ncbi:MAG: hypothetical protein GY790_01680 [Bacteroidetes bacterium]|nr:hypothetical protein [Bacteroidota bacterium]
MKTSRTLAVCLYATLLSGMTPVIAQGVDDQLIDIVDLKMNLAETKLDLLDSRISLWEEKPAALEMKLYDIENRIKQLSFSPEQFNQKFDQLDSLLEKQQSLMAEQSEIHAKLDELAYQDPSDSLAPSDSRAPSDSNSSSESGPIMISAEKYVISMYPIRLVEGTMQLSLERVLNRGNSIELSAMATYATKEGLANYYLSNQRLEYYNADLASYTSYESENISGYGVSLAWRNYLLPRTKPNYAAPRGAYVAPMIMYRRLTLSGFDQIFNEETEIYEPVEITQYLNVLFGGFLAGWQFVLWKAITADVYVGGIIRLSKYDGDAHFTKYKQVQNIDFSGVMPSFGVKIGIIK